MVDFIAEYVPKEFIGNLSSFLFRCFPPPLEMLDGYDEFKKDPHYRALRNSKSESEPSLRNLRKHRRLRQLKESRTASIRSCHHTDSDSGCKVDCSVQLVPVPVKTVSVVPLDSGDPGPPS
ncbi:hypothetical protein PAPYR_12502 [Paratrimastix pyriformis]|uniref:Uncharacterized protein n=1 Tax=Paratrimastix pyriformis TaxID=342808 RepID=A0ABQ8U5L1_9EUKA|nr:hypothetical protein PAPYR_12502 [Paratrimastix pyriformis]